MKHLFPKTTFIYLVTDQNCLKNQTLEQAVEQAILGGVKMVQLREKNANAKQIFEKALKIKAICQHYHVPFLINDRVDIALAVDADGVHLGQSDLPADIARQLLGEDKIIGVSARTVAQAKQAQQQGADYLGVGAVFGTATKNDAEKIDLQTLQAIYQNSDLPMVLIGGINQNNLSILQEGLNNIGVQPAGFAVVSAVLAQEDVQKSSQVLSEKISFYQVYPNFTPII